MMVCLARGGALSGWGAHCGDEFQSQGRMCKIPKAEVAKERQLVASPRMEPSRTASVPTECRQVGCSPAPSTSLRDVIPTSGLSVDLRTIRGK